MKNTLLLLVVGFIFSGIIANAQQADTIRVLDPGKGANIQASIQKGEKDTARHKELIIMKKRLANEVESKIIIDQKRANTQAYIEGRDISQKEDRVVINLNGNGKGDGKDDIEFSRLGLSKSFKGESIETTKKFSVLPNYNMVRFELYGLVKSGVISITLIKPNGNKFKSIEIDATSNVSFDQFLDLKKNPKEWIGDWQIKINADKADGNYRLDITTR